MLSKISAKQVGNTHPFYPMMLPPNTVGICETQSGSSTENRPEFVSDSPVSPLPTVPTVPNQYDLNASLCADQKIAIEEDDRDHEPIEIFLDVPQDTGQDMKIEDDQTLPSTSGSTVEPVQTNQPNESVIPIQPKQPEPFYVPPGHVAILVSGLGNVQNQPVQSNSVNEISPGSVQMQLNERFHARQINKRKAKEIFTPDDMKDFFKNDEKIYESKRQKILNENSEEPQNLPKNSFKLKLLGINKGNKKSAENKNPLKNCIFLVEHTDMEASPDDQTVLVPSKHPKYYEFVFRAIQGNSLYLQCINYRKTKFNKVKCPARLTLSLDGTKLATVTEPRKVSDWLTVSQRLASF